MRLTLYREPSIADATLGVLFVDFHWECFVLEDQIREPLEHRGLLVRDWKVAGNTAIPAGLYRIVITHSARFGRRLPLLEDVPGFSGIRIHPGNTIADTEGCLLPGRLRAAGRVGESRVAFDRLFAKLEAAIARGEEAWIAIVNPPIGNVPAAAAAVAA